MTLPSLPNELAQGLGDFKSFDDYRAGWILRNMLPDLVTVFSGAGPAWKMREEKGETEGDRGRGDMVLGGILFTVLEQLGAFLGTRGEPLTATENVIRTLQHFFILKEFDVLVARLSRNPLMHFGWPQTGLLMPGNKWGVGLNISAREDLTQHCRVYVRRSYEVGRGSPFSRDRVPVVKFRLNVHAMLRELEGLFVPGRPFGAGGIVDPKRYQEVRDLFIAAGGIEEPPPPRRVPRELQEKRKTAFLLQARTLQNFAKANNLFRRAGDNNAIRLEEFSELWRGDKRKEP